MKNSLAQPMSVNSMVIFWLGLLTGALIVGLVFFYRVLNPGDYESAILKSPKYAPKATMQVAPKAKMNALPSPTGNLNALPSPTGN